MEEYMVEKYWMCGIICIMAFYALSFWLLTALGKNKRARKDPKPKASNSQGI